MYDELFNKLNNYGILRKDINKMNLLDYNLNEEDYLEILEVVDKAIKSKMDKEKIQYMILFTLVYEKRHKGTKCAHIINQKEIRCLSDRINRKKRQESFKSMNIKKSADNLYEQSEAIGYFLSKVVNSVEVGLLVPLKVLSDSIEGNKLILQMVIKLIKRS